mgnify:CR=1 FL=1
MPQLSYHVILNASAGTANATGVTPQALETVFADRGLDATVDADVEAPLDERIARALESDADVIVAGGGDGTIAALAGALAGTDKALAVLPLGTVNAVARDLGLPLTLEQAVDGIAGGELRQIDIGEVNGRLFLHMAAVGFVAGIAAAREKVRGRFGFLEFISFSRFFARRLARSRRMALAIAPDEGEARVERAQAFAVVCSEFSEGFGRMFSRDKLDSGTLTLYVVKHLSASDLVRLTLGMFLGRWRQDEALRIEHVREVTVDTRKPTLKVMLDGEIVSIETPLVFKVRPLALTMVMPAEAAPADAPAAGEAAT